MSAEYFWKMPPKEFWWLIDAKLPPEIVDREETMDKLAQMMKDAKKNG